jgi:hypothetical protein
MRRVFTAVSIALTTACSSLPPSTSVTTLVDVQRVDSVGVIAREPMLAEHPDGTLFVAGYGEPRPTLFRSADRGATWTRVDVGSEAGGAIGNSDVDLAVARDGTLYFISMLFDRTVNEGRQIAIGVSTDVGATWRWTTLAQERYDDRPWIEVAPDGTAHAIWNDGSGVSYRASRDRGETWTPMVRIHDKGGSSHLAVGPNGEVAVRITPLSASAWKYDAGVDLIAVSSDGGASWQKYAAPGERDWSPEFESAGTPRWVEPLAWDAAGKLYSLWTDKKGVRVARSDDRGAHWRSWTIADTPAPAFFPYLVARGSGELAATWFTASKDHRDDLRWQVAQIDGERVAASSPLQLESRRKRDGSEAFVNDPGGEYLAVAFLRDGSIAVVSPIQNRPEGRVGFTFWRFAER